MSGRVQGPPRGDKAGPGEAAWVWAGLTLVFVCVLLLVAQGIWWVVS